MKTKNLILAAALLALAFVSTSNATPRHDGARVPCPPVACAPVPCPIVRVWRAWPGSVPYACPPRIEFPLSISPVEIVLPAPRLEARAAPCVAASEARVTVTITIPASLARELVASGAIKLPAGK